MFVYTGNLSASQTSGDLSSQTRDLLQRARGILEKGFEKGNQCLLKNSTVLEG